MWKETVVKREREFARLKPQHIVIHESEAVHADRRLHAEHYRACYVDYEICVMNRKWFVVVQRENSFHVLN